MAFIEIIFAAVLLIPPDGGSVPLMSTRIRNIRETKVDSEEPMKINLMTNNRYYEYTEGHTMDFNCSVTGDFKDTLTLTLGGKVKAQGQKVVRFSGPAAIENNDQQLKCTLTDDILSPIERIITVFYAPRSDDCTADSVCEIKGSFVDDQNATVRVRIRANPKPYLYQWTLADNMDLDRERFKQLDAGDSKYVDGQWEAKLEINVVNPEDFNTIFTFQATNDYGSVTYNFTISAVKSDSSSFPSWIIWTCIGILTLILITAIAVFQIYKKLSRRKSERKNSHNTTGGSDPLLELHHNKSTSLNRRDKIKAPKSERVKLQFRPEEVEALRVLPLLALINIKEIDMSLIPAYTIVENNAIPNDVELQEFIPMARVFLNEHSATLKDANKLVQQKFNNMILLDSDRKLLVDSIKKVEFKLSSDVLEKVNGCESGVKISGLARNEDKVLFAKLLQNSIPNLFFIACSGYLQLNLQENSFSGVLVVIDDRRNSYSDPNFNTMRHAKIICLVNSESDLHQAAPKIEHLDEESQEKLQNTKLQFIGNEVEAKHLFRQEIDEYTITEILSLKSNSAVDVKEGNDFYFEQTICSSGKEKNFIGTAEEFANSYDTKECVLVLGASEMGKSAAMSKIIAALQEKLPHYCIIICNPSNIEPNFQIKNDLKDVCKTAIKMNATSLVVKNEWLLEKVLTRKLETKEVIFVADSLDQLEPIQINRLQNFINVLKKLELGVIVAARNKMLLGSKMFSLDNVYNVKPITGTTDRIKFVADYLKSTGTEMTEKAIEHLLADVEDGEDELWGLPLHLMLVADALKVQTHTNYCPLKLLIEGATRIALEDIEEQHYTRQSTYFKKTVYRLAACEMFNKGKYLQTIKTAVDWNESYLEKFPLLSINKITQTVSFKHKRFSDFLVAEALVRAFHQDPDVEKLDFDKDRIEWVLTGDKSETVRACMEIILHTNDFKDRKCKSINGELGNIKSILLALIKENKLELYKLLEDCHANIDYMQVWDGQHRWQKAYPLYEAMEHANEEFVRYLVEKGASLTTIPNDKPYVLRRALKFLPLNDQVKEYFNELKHKNIVTTLNTIKEAQRHATESKNVEMVKFFEEKSFAIEKDL